MIVFKKGGLNLEKILDLLQENNTAYIKAERSFCIIFLKSHKISFMSDKKNNNFWSQAGFGALIGFINGFFGGGGGMIVVPVLEKIYRFERKNSHATSIALILPITVISAIIYLIGAKIDWAILGVCTLGVVAGGAGGAFILKKVRSRIIGYLFCAVMLIAGIRLLF